MVPAAAEATRGDAAPSRPAPQPAAASGSATKSAAGGRALRRSAHARARSVLQLPARAHGSRRGQRQISRGEKLCACAARRGCPRRLRRPLPLKGDAPASPAPPEAALFRHPIPRNAAVLCRSDRRCGPRARAGSHEGTPSPHEQPPSARPLDAVRRSPPASPRSGERRIHPQQRPVRQLCSLPLHHVRFSQGTLMAPGCPPLPCAGCQVGAVCRAGIFCLGIRALRRSHGTPVRAPAMLTSLSLPSSKPTPRMQQSLRGWLSRHRRCCAPLAGRPSSRSAPPCGKGEEDGKGDG